MKLIIEYWAQGMSQREIACTRKMSFGSISKVCHIAKEKKITYEELKNLDDTQAYELFFKTIHKQSVNFILTVLFMNSACFD